MVSFLCACVCVCSDCRPVGGFGKINHVCLKSFEGLLQYKFKHLLDKTEIDNCKAALRMVK